MNRSHREGVATVGAIMDQAGVAWKTHMGGKHLQIEITAPDGTVHRMPISGSPHAGIDCANNNQRQQAYRLLERLGINVDRGTGTTPSPHPRRRHVNRTIGAFPRPDPDAPPTRLSRDPWAALATLHHPVEPDCQDDQHESILEP